MPYPNEHSCRLRDPDNFQDNSLHRVSRTHDSKKYVVITGRLKGKETMTEQTYRYPKEEWTPSEAQVHCNDHDGILFEPAEEEALMKQFWNEKPSRSNRRPDRYLCSIREHKFIDEDTVEVVASTGTINRLRERVRAKAWRVDNYLNNPVVLWSHDWDLFPIAKTVSLEVKEDQMVHRMVFSPLEMGQQAKILVREGFLNAVSYGFIINAFEIKKEQGQEIREVTDAEILELSWVNVPADAGALQTRSLYMMPNLELGNGILFRGAIPYKETPKADEGEDWDAGKEVADADVDDLKVMCAWYDAEYPNIKTSYKLPHHKAADPHAVVWRAVAAAGAAIMGARGGVDIPAGDVAGVKAHLGRHYAEFDKEPPWEREASVSSWARKMERMEHLVKELKSGKKDSPVDLEMLQEIMVITLDLRANIGQEALVDVIRSLGDLLGKEDTDVGGVLDDLSARWISTKISGQLSSENLERIRSINAEQGAMRERLKRLGR